MNRIMAVVGLGLSALLIGATSDGVGDGARIGALELKVQALEARVAALDNLEGRTKALEKAVTKLMQQAPAASPPAAKVAKPGAAPIADLPGKWHWEKISQFEGGRTGGYYDTAHGTAYVAGKRYGFTATGPWRARWSTQGDAVFQVDFTHEEVRMVGGRPRTYDVSVRDPVRCVGTDSGSSDNVAGPGTYTIEINSGQIYNLTIEQQVAGEGGKPQKGPVKGDGEK